MKGLVPASPHLHGGGWRYMTGLAKAKYGPVRITLISMNILDFLTYAPLDLKDIVTNSPGWVQGRFVGQKLCENSITVKCFELTDRRHVTGPWDRDIKVCLVACETISPLTPPPPGLALSTINKQSINETLPAERDRISEQRCSAQVTSPPAQSVAPESE
ncbi:hypothetical protein J6590_026110 [Homalodisca vitripennis]|nr:hypothetical protein J6590_026110 [Homalodisca vitripennis]